MHIILIISLIFGIVFIRAINKGKYSRKIEVIFGGSLIFMYSALRSETVGIDLPTYVANFHEISKLSSYDILFHSTGYNWSRDPVFYIFLKVLSLFSANPQIMIVAISAVVSISVSAFIYRTSSDVLIAFLLFICLRYFSFTLTGLRQAISISIILLSFKYLENNRTVLSISYIITASLFHFSALFFIIAVKPIRNLTSIKYVVFSGLLIIGLVFSVSNFVTDLIYLIPAFGERFSSYGIMDKNISGIGTLLTYLIIFLLGFIPYRKIKLNKRLVYNHQSTNYILHFNMLIVGLIIAVLGLYIPNIFRIGYYFIIPGILCIFTNLHYYNATISLFIKYVFISLVIIQYIYFGPGAGTENYSFFWQ